VKLLQRLAFATLLVATGTAAQAQTAGAPKGRARFEIGAAFMQSPGTSSFSATQTNRENLENATFTASYNTKAAPGGSFHVQYNVTRSLGVRVGGTSVSRKSDATYSGQSPHPFFFNRPRSYSGEQKGLGFEESAFTVSAVLHGESGKWNYALDAGAAFFTLNATIIDRPQLTDTYPFDTVIPATVTSTKKSASPKGVSVGVELGRALTDAITVYARGGYAGGSADLDVNGTPVNVKAGGAEARLGVKFTLGRK
jgi:opacity protein-like surface antigen